MNINIITVKEGHKNSIFNHQRTSWNARHTVNYQREIPEN